MGSYRILGLVAEGGMGRIYLAEHTRLGRRVALKSLRSEHAHNPTTVSRFFEEARAVNRIRHEHIVEITDFIEEAGGDNYYIMEMLDGLSLSQLLEKEGFVDVPRAVDIALQIADALAVVHAAGIIHRDLKPDNIYLTRRSGRDDYVKLLDFGVAKLLDSAENKPLHQTAAGAILGSPEYMSPEQAGGKIVDHRTDVYSLGVILYEMVTGHKPFEAKSYGEMVIKHITVPPPLPKQRPDRRQEIPEELEALILACLSKKPEERPAGMREIAAQLEEMRDWMQFLPHEASPPAPRRGRRLAWALAFIVGAAIPVGMGIHLGWLEGGAPAADSGSDGGRAGKVSRHGDAGSLLEQVEVQFDSEPAGAVVYPAGSERPLGRTPLVLALPRTSRAREFEFRLAEHEHVSRRVRLDENTRVAVVLPAVPPLEPPDFGGKNKKRRRRRKGDGEVHKAAVNKPAGKHAAGAGGSGHVAPDPQGKPSGQDTEAKEAHKPDGGAGAKQSGAEFDPGATVNPFEEEE